MTTPKAKETHLQIRIRQDIKEDLRITSELKGLSISALVHSLIVKAVREEKEREPQAFEGKISTRLNLSGDIGGSVKDAKNKSASAFTNDAGIDQEEIPFVDIKDQREPLDDEQKPKQKRRKSS